MDGHHTNSTRARWAAIGAALAVALGAGGIGVARATSPGNATTFVPITPCRIIDTRPEPAFNVGTRSTPLGGGDTLTVSAHGDNGNCTGIPSAATALSLNVTAVDATMDTYLTIWPTGEPQPDASSLNPTPGQTPAPNAVTTALSASGRFDVYNLQGEVHVIADVNGYYVDHHHDDRYYTKTQVDAELDAAVVDRPTSDAGKLAYAWMCDADPALGVTIDITACGGGVQAYHFNPSGGAITAQRTAVGEYIVTFAGLSMSGGHYQVTAYGTESEHCKLRQWGGSAALVDCYNFAGGAVDSAFAIMAID